MVWLTFRPLHCAQGGKAKLEVKVAFQMGKLEEDRSVSEPDGHSSSRDQKQNAGWSTHRC